MKFSESYIPTLKETPADAEAISHKLLLRAGLARKLAAGLYLYLPLGLRVLKKISAIVAEEMNRAGFQELLLPMVQPADLWEETGRWKYYGKELLRFKDRNSRDYCLGPTHEEVITDLVRSEIKSYRQLPCRLYQIQTKFRDEMRPRFGLMRGREFVMKDAYSFDADDDAASRSYQLMFDAYMRIFTRLGLKFRAVEADSGSIGGNFSHEFMVLADTGEDTIAVCDNCGYGANVERAEIIPEDIPAKTECPVMEKVLTPGAHTVEQVSEMLNVKPFKLIKTLIFKADGNFVAVLGRGDHEINELKLKKLLNAEEVMLASAKDVERITKAPLGFAGPVNLDIPIYADNELAQATDYIAGANEKDAHFLHIDLQRDVKIAKWADLRLITGQDPCPLCKNRIQLVKGIEVGHIFKLGEKYSKPMRAVYLDETGCEKNMIMGCYGIGISRLVAAAIEQGHDDKGIIFSPQITPFDCILINLDPKNETVNHAVDKVLAIMEKKGLEVLVDDRIERPGVKFNDADLLGFPVQAVIGAKSLGKGLVECKNRKTGEKIELPLEQFEEKFAEWRQKVLENWNINEPTA